MAKLEKPSKEKEGDLWYVGEVATKTERLIVNRDTEEQYNIELALTLILNKLEKIEKSTVG